MHKLPVEDTGALGVRGEQPNHKCDFQLEIKGKPERKREEKKKREREKDGELESRSAQRQMERTGREQHRQKEQRQDKGSETKESIYQVRIVEPSLES